MTAAAAADRVSKQDGSGRQVTAATAIDDVSAHILHVDMDAFFASVELLEHPELVGKPVIVGHPSARSVVTAATYEARKFGVNSAMPMAVALRRCPQAIVLEPHYDRYTHFSGIVMDLFRDVTPHVEVLGIDEAFLDVASARRLLGTPWQIGTLIRERVFTETGLRCSVGAAATKYVAKLASSRSKPDGLLVVPEADTLGFLHPQPISALWGVGVKPASSCPTGSVSARSAMSPRSPSTLSSPRSAPRWPRGSATFTGPRPARRSERAEKSVGRRADLRDATSSIAPPSSARCCDSRTRWYAPYGVGTELEARTVVVKTAVRRLLYGHAIAHARRPDRRRARRSMRRRAPLYADVRVARFAPSGCSGCGASTFGRRLRPRPVG